MKFKEGKVEYKNQQELQIQFLIAAYQSQETDN